MKRTVLITIVAVIAAAIVSCASSAAGGGDSAARGPGGSWTFENPDAGTNGWELATAEFYQYRAAAELTRDDATFGRGMLRLDVDFSGAKNLEWSEPKLKNDFPRSLNMRGLTQFAFDFYYNPSLCTTGTFKAKIFSNSNGLKIDFTSNDIGGGEDVGNGYLKVPMVILIMPTAGYMSDMRLSVAGCLTDYKGPVFFDNLRWE
jgi:hypothetical protein